MADTVSGERIRINRSTLGKQFFAERNVGQWLCLIVHELAHRVGNGHDFAFWREVERLWSEAVVIVQGNPDQSNL